MSNWRGEINQLIIGEFRLCAGFRAKGKQMKRSVDDFHASNTHSRTKTTTTTTTAIPPKPSSVTLCTLALYWNAFSWTLRVFVCMYIMCAVAPVNVYVIRSRWIYGGCNNFPFGKIELNHTARSLIVVWKMNSSSKRVVFLDWIISSFLYPPLLLFFCFV